MPLLRKTLWLRLNIPIPFISYRKKRDIRHSGVAWLELRYDWNILNLASEEVSPCDDCPGDSSNLETTLESVVSRP